MSPQWKKMLTVICAIASFAIGIAITQSLKSAQIQEEPNNPVTRPPAIQAAIQRVEEQGFQNANTNDMIIFAMAHLNNEIETLGNRIFNRLDSFTVPFWLIAYSAFGSMIAYVAVKIWDRIGQN